MLARLRLDFVAAAHRARNADNAVADALALGAARSVVATFTLDQFLNVVPLWERLQATMAAQGRELHRATAAADVAALERWGQAMLAEVWAFNEAAREALTPRQRAIIVAQHRDFPHDPMRIMRHIFLLTTQPVAGAAASVGGGDLGRSRGSVQEWVFHVNDGASWGESLAGDSAGMEEGEDKESGGEPGYSGKGGGWARPPSEPAHAAPALPAAAHPARSLPATEPAAPEGQGLSSVPATTAAPLLQTPPTQRASTIATGTVLPAGQAAASPGVLAAEVALLKSKLDLAEAQLLAAREAADDLAGQGSAEQLPAWLEVERRENEVETAILKLSSAQRRLARSYPQAA